MEAVVRVVDETPSGERTDGLVLRVLGPEITVADLIRRRVEAEAVLHNAGRPVAHDTPQAWRSLVDAEACTDITDPGIDPCVPIDAEVQVRVAHEAFRRNGFFVLIDDQQAGSLDDVLALGTDTTVSFLRVLPLYS